MTLPVLITGATGFVGSRLAQHLMEQGVATRCASRNPGRAKENSPQHSWVHFDLDDSASMDAALQGTKIAIYLVHLLAEGHGYAERERQAARNFARLAARHGLERVVYLGGVAPQGPPSDHLQSRLDTGKILREGEVPCIELRAGMIIGEGSESWKICRDLSARLPFMLLPRWMQSRSCPVGIDDVITGLCASLSVPLEGSVVYDLPGPEVLSAEEILVRAARLRGMQPLTLSLPVLTPKLSSYWLKLVSGADFVVAQELVHGLVYDLLPTQRSLWDDLPGLVPTGFDEAVRRAMAEERGLPSPRLMLLETLARRLATASC